ncbi:hypothetical protein WSM22_17560 [Cytophagales bacterium WSM2-2]|nr:hypothetical protein WSM22_17560 [Cytophagales bacterium WSM2-2]
MLIFYLMGLFLIACNQKTADKEQVTEVVHESDTVANATAPTEPVESVLPEPKEIDLSASLENIKNTDQNGEITSDWICVDDFDFPRYYFIYYTSCAARPEGSPIRYNQCMTVDREGRPARIKFPASWLVKDDTLFVYYKPDSINKYKIASLTSIKMKLTRIQEPIDWFFGTSDDTILLYRDEIKVIPTVNDIIGSWKTPGDFLNLKRDGKFSFDREPNCHADGTWRLEKDKIILSFDNEPCVGTQLTEVNEFGVSTYTLTIVPEQDGKSTTFYRMPEKR